MNNNNIVTKKSYPVEAAIQAQAALRKLAGLGPEVFPVEAFIGMISDEIEILRRQGHNDEQIAQVIRDNSKIEVTSAEIAANYVSPEQRQQPHD